MSDNREMTERLVCSFLERNQIPHKDLPELIREVYVVVATLEVGEDKPQPAVPVENSVTDDFLVCLEDGQKVTLLKRHLQTNFDMTPEEYRRKWNLPDDYPMVAKSYSEKRSQIAKRQGLGRQQPSPERDR